MWEPKQLELLFQILSKYVQDKEYSPDNFEQSDWAEVYEQSQQTVPLAISPSSVKNAFDTFWKAYQEGEPWAIESSCSNYLDSILDYYQGSDQELEYSDTLTEQSSSDDTESDAPNQPSIPTPGRRGRGRPRKHPLPAGAQPAKKVVKPLLKTRRYAAAKPKSRPIALQPPLKPSTGSLSLSTIATSHDLSEVSKRKSNVCQSCYKQWEALQNQLKSLQQNITQMEADNSRRKFQNNKDEETKLQAQLARTQNQVAVFKSEHNRIQLLYKQSKVDIEDLKKELARLTESSKQENTNPKLFDHQKLSARADELINENRNLKEENKKNEATSRQALDEAAKEVDQLKAQLHEWKSKWTAEHEQVETMDKRLQSSDSMDLDIPTIQASTEGISVSLQPPQPPRTPPRLFSSELVTARKFLTIIRSVYRDQVSNDQFFRLPSFASTAPDLVKSFVSRQEEIDKNPTATIKQQQEVLLTNILSRL